MKRVKYLKVLFVTCITMLFLTNNIVAQEIPVSERDAVKEFFDELYAGSVRLKGGGANIPALATSYCSEDDYVELVPPAVHPSTDSIVWTVAVYTEMLEEHPEWGEYEGSGNSTVFRFYPNRVDDEYLNTDRIYLGYQQFDALGLPVGSAGNDYTYVRVTPTQFNFGSDQSICAGQSADLVLDGSEIDIDYYLYKDGVDAGQPENGTGSPIIFNVTEAGTYTVRAVNAIENECAKDILGSATVTVDPLPDVDAGADQEICEGSAATLTATSSISGATYLWSTGETTASINVSPVATATYTVEVANPATGCTNSDNITVTVNPLPDVDAGSDVDYCIGSPAVTLTATSSVSGVAYSWSTGETTASINVTPSSTTTYSVEVTNPATGCINSDNVTVTVNPLPDVDAGVDQETCDGSAVTLTASTSVPGATYLWNTGETTAGISVSPTTTTTYTVEVTNAATGCVNSDNVTVTVNPLPDVDAGADQEICEGSATTLTASTSVPGATYLWNTGETTASITVSPATTTTYTVEVTNPATGCVNSDNVTVTVNPLPDIDAGIDQEMCVGSGPVTLTATSTVPGVTYLWSTGETTASITVSPATTITYTVGATNPATGCVNSDNVTVTVNPLPDVNAGADQEICEGSDATLTATSSVAGATYLWSTGETSASINVSPTAETSYTVEVTNPATGCTNSDNVTVILNPLPDVDAGADQEICEGSAATLTGSTSVSGAVYLWSTGETSASINVSPIATTTYTVEVTNPATGCVNSDIVTVNVNTVTASISVTAPVVGSTTICAGTPVTFNAGGADGSGNYNYEFHIVRGGVDSPQPEITATYTTSDLQNGDEVYVIVTDNNTLCTAQSASIVMTVNDNPVVNLNISSPDGNTVCNGSSVVFEATSGYANYVYYVNNAEVQDSPSNILSVNTLRNGDEVYVVASSAAGCSASSVPLITMTVYELPVVSPTYDPVCDGGDLQLYANPTGGSNTYTGFAWTTDFDTYTSPDEDALRPNIVKADHDGNYYVVVTDDNNCSSVPTPVAVSINDLPLPTITGASAACNGTTNIYTTESGMSNYVWNVTGGAFTDNGDNIEVTWNTLGNQIISVSYTDANSCGVASPSEYIVNVVGLPSPSIAGDKTACTEHTYTYATESGAINYDWHITGGAITPTADPHIVYVIWDNTGSQSISVNYELGGCPAGTPTDSTVVVSDVPVVSLSGNNNVCLGVPGNVYVTESGQSNYNWTIIGGTIDSDDDNGTVSVTWVAEGAQAISVNYDNLNGCSALDPTSLNVTVNQLPVPTINGASSVCNNSTITYTTDAGMSSYVWTVTGGTFVDNGESVDVTWNTLGDQTISVTYTDANSCNAAVVTDLPVVVNEVPVPTITGSEGVCNSSTEVYTTESGNNNYIWNVTGGSIISGEDTHEVSVLWDTDGPQTISVNYGLAGGCSAETPTVHDVTVNPLPEATLDASPGTSILTGTEVTFTAGGGNEYIFYINGAEVQSRSSNNEFITSSLVDNDAVTVDVISSEDCTVTLSLDIRVYEGLLAFDVIPESGEYCAGESGIDIALSDSQSGITYELIRVSDNYVVSAVVSNGIDPVSWTNVTGTYEYKVEAYNAAVPADRIEMNNRVVVTENVLPQLYDMSPTGTETTCNSATPITLNGSEPGVNYQLLINSAPIGDVMSGTGASLDFGTYSFVGIYEISAINSTTGCTSIMNGTWQIDVANSGGTYDVSTDANIGPADGRYCAGGDGANILLSGSDNGVDYGLFINGVSADSIISGTGDAINFGLQHAEGVYTVAVNISGCYFPMNGSVTVNEVNEPDVFGLYAENEGHFCADDADGVEIYLDNQEEGIQYQLLHEGNTVGDIIEGTVSGTRLSFGMHTEAGQYAVIATVPVVGCTSQTDSVSLVVDPVPVTMTLEGDSSYCEGGGSALLYINNPENDVTYELWYDDESGSGFVATGDNGSISGGRLEWLVASEGTYKINGLKHNSQVDCGPVDVTNEKEVGFTPLPLDKDLLIIEGDLATCEGTTIKVPDSETGMNYAVISNITDIILPGYQMIGNGDTLVFDPIVDKGGSYRVEAYNGSCGIIIDATLTNPILVDYPNAVSKKEIESPATICEGDGGVQIGVINGDADITYVLYRIVNDADVPYNHVDDIPVDTIVPPHNPIQYFIDVYDEGEYQVIGYADVNILTDQCNSAMLETVNVTFNPLPTAYRVLGSGISCDDTPAIIGLEGSEVNYEYFLVYNNISGKELVQTVIGTGSKVTFTGVSTEGKYSVYSLSDKGCSSSMKDTVDVRTVDAVADQLLTQEFYSYCSGSDGAELILQDQEYDVMYEVRDTSGNTILSQIGNDSGSQLVLGKITEGVYEIVGSFNDACERMLNDSNLVVVTSTPAKPFVSVSPDSMYCYGGDGVDVWINNSEVDIYYLLIDTNTGETKDIVIGDGFDVKFANSVRGSSEYIVRAESNIGGSKCENDSDPFMITEKDELYTYNLTISYSDGSHNIDCTEERCYGLIEIDTIKLDMSTLGVNYILINETTPVDTLVGTGDELSFGTLQSGGNYWILAEYNGCSATMNGNIHLAIQPLIAKDDLVSLQGGELFVEYDVVENDIKLPGVDVFPEQGNDSLKYRNLQFSLIQQWSYFDDSGNAKLHETIGGVTINSEGKLEYRKVPNFYGHDSVRYKVWNTEFPERVDTATVFVFVGNVNVDENKDLLIPNAFSPNDDGVNDYYVISGSFKDELAISKLEVFNRWGTIVYRSKGSTYKDDWDGTSNAGAMVSLGHKLPDGTYFFVFTLEVNNEGKISQKKYTGFIELRR